MKQKPKLRYEYCGSECSLPPKSKKVKPWIIEYRYIGELTLIVKKWEVHKHYATQKDRDKAFDALTAPHIKNRIWEYRKVDPARNFED